MKTNRNLLVASILGAVLAISLCAGLANAQLVFRGKFTQVRTVGGYTIDATTGALTSVPGSPFRTAAARTAVLGTPPKPITISIQSDTPLGVFQGRAYREIHAFMSSNAPGDAHTKPGSYSVPIVIACPVRAHDFSGFGLVDVLNTTFIDNAFANPLGGEGRALPLARILIGDETLFGSGVFYIAVQWDAFAIGVTGGTISNPSIGNEIIRDASRVLRNPSAYLPNGVGQDVHDVIGFGYSQSAAIVLGLYVQGLNALPE